MRTYRDYLFVPLHEVLDDKTMMDMGRMWQKHHDRDPYKRFEQTAMDKSAVASEKMIPTLVKYYDKREELENGLQNAPNTSFNPSHKYRPGEIKPKGYYQKALNSLDGITKYSYKYPGAQEEYDTRLSRYQGRKLGWEENPGVDTTKLSDLHRVFPYKKWARHDDTMLGVNTMHQRAGEKSMAAIGRLTNYLNRNGVNQENPTARDRANFERFRQRMSGHPLWKNS